jgi:hypothetical protein
MTDVRIFQPLPDRLADLPVDETLHDGVPIWLDLPLRDWLQSVFRDEGPRGSEHLASRVLMRLRWAKDNERQTYVVRVGLCQGTDLLHAADAVLQLHPAWEPGPPIPASVFRAKLVNLEGILTDAGSMYRIDVKGRRLVRRVDATVQAAVDAVITTATSLAGAYLRTAWVAAYGLHPDPDKAYDHAILAIEELTCPLVCPRNDRATLGIVVRELRDHAGQWELSMGDTRTGRPATIDNVIGMLDLLWRGQSRHAGSTNSRQQTQAEAEAAVHMAAALTQWLSTGVLYRRP